MANLEEEDFQEELEEDIEEEEEKTWRRNRERSGLAAESIPPRARGFHRRLVP